MDGKFFPRLRPRELCEAALGKALPQKNAEEKGPKRKASVLLSCWDARGCSQEGEPVDQIGRRGQHAGAEGEGHLGAHMVQGEDVGGLADEDGVVGVEA